MCNYLRSKRGGGGLVPPGERAHVQPFLLSLFRLMSDLTLAVLTAELYTPGTPRELLAVLTAELYTPGTPGELKL